jgi:hypothetical protein
VVTPLPTLGALLVVTTRSKPALADGEPRVHAHVVVGRRDGTTRGGICSADACGAEVVAYAHRQPTPREPEPFCERCPEVEEGQRPEPA